MSIERECFSFEESTAMQAILNAYPKATKEGTKMWLDRWYESKKPLIELFGGLYTFGFCRPELYQDEEAEDAKKESSYEQVRDRFRRELVEMFRGRDPKLMPYILVDKRYIPNLSPWFRTIKEKYEFERVTQCSQTSLAIDDADTGPWELLNMHPHIIKPHYLDRIFINPSSTAVHGATTVSNILDEDDFMESPIMKNFYGVRFEQILNGIIHCTLMEDVLNNKTVTGMKITKFLKKMYPDEWIAFHYPQEDGRVLSFWEAFEKEWSMLIQKYRKLPTNDTKEKPDIVVSVSPVDYLMMSEAQTWQSCHQLKGNLYATGGPGYSVDTTSAVAFAPRGLMEKYGVSFYDKSWRQMVFIDRENGAAVFGREYPQGNSSLARATRGAVNYALADYHEVARKWWQGNNTGHFQLDSAYVYRDPMSAATRLKEINEYPAGFGGASILFCFKCGNHAIEPDENSRKNLICRICNGTLQKLPIEHYQRFSPGTIDAESLLSRNLSERNNQHSCSVCGSCRQAKNLYRVKRGSIDDRRLLVCRECLHIPPRVNDYGIYKCEQCHTLHTTSSASIYLGRVICARCRDNIIGSITIVTCDICGEGIDEESAGVMANGGFYCYSCEEDVATCDGCGDVGHCDNIYYIESLDVEYCESCRDELPFCDHCGEHVEHTESVGIHEYCNTCIADHCLSCERCGSITLVGELRVLRSQVDDTDYYACIPCRGEITMENAQFRALQDERRIV